MQRFNTAIRSFALWLDKSSEERLSTSPRTKEVILLLAIVFLMAGLYISISSSPQLLDDVEWGIILVIVIIGVPATILLNALEFIVIGRMVDRTIDWNKAIEITTIGSAANMMPLPGSTIVRVASLKRSGVGYKLSATITLLVSIVWIGVAFVYAGSMVVIWAEPAPGLALMAAGLSALVAVSVLIRHFGIARSKFVFLLLTKACLVLVDAMRIYLCFIALKVTLEFWQASIFVISSVLGSAVSIVPAGIGVRELLSSGIAPLVGLPAAAGFLTATLNRVLGLSVLLPVAGVLTLREKQRVSK